MLLAEELVIKYFSHWYAQPDGWSRIPFFNVFKQNAFKVF